MWRIWAKKAEWVSRVDSSPCGEIKWLFSSGAIGIREESALTYLAPRGGRRRPDACAAAHGNTWFTISSLRQQPLFYCQAGRGEAVGAERHPHTHSHRDTESFHDIMENIRVQEITWILFRQMEAFPQHATRGFCLTWLRKRSISQPKPGVSHTLLGS